jgi:hypothetical protein
MLNVVLEVTSGKIPNSWRPRIAAAIPTRIAPRQAGRRPRDGRPTAALVRVTSRIPIGIDLDHPMIVQARQKGAARTREPGARRGPGRVQAPKLHRRPPCGPGSRTPASCRLSGPSPNVARHSPRRPWSSSQIRSIHDNKRHRCSPTYKRNSLARRTAPSQQKSRSVPTWCRGCRRR